MGRKPRVFSNRLIALEGPIGVGKTTLAVELARRLGGRTLFEESENNPFLPDFYKNPERAAFQTQLFFLLSRYQQQQFLRQEELFHQVTICDYIFQKDRIFAGLTLSSEELLLYDKVYTMLVERVPKPDLVVYLKARPEVLLERIRGRNRNWERPITLDYLRKLTQAYNDYFFHYNLGSLLVVNTSDIDIVEREADLDQVIRVIRDMKKGVEHYNPMPTG